MVKPPKAPTRTNYQLPTTNYQLTRKPLQHFKTSTLQHFTHPPSPPPLRNPVIQQSSNLAIRPSPESPSTPSSTPYPSPPHTRLSSPSSASSSARCPKRSANTPTSSRNTLAPSS